MKINFIKILTYLNNKFLMRFFDKSSRNFLFNSKLNNKNQLYASPTKRQMKSFKSTVLDNDGFFKSLNKIVEDFDGNICLDVGSNIGYCSIAFNKYLERDKIIFSFEPQRRNMNYLSYNLRNERNIISLQLGLSSKIQDLSLGIPSYTHKRGGEHPQNTGNMSVFHNDGSLDCIRFITIDSFLNGVINKEERVFLIKIDVEGFEKEVVDGMMSCVEIHRPLVILEINPDTQLIADYDLKIILDKFLHRKYKFAVPKSSELVIDKKGIPNISLNMLLCPEENYRKVDQNMNYKNFNYN